MEKSPATATSHLKPVLPEPCGVIIFLKFLTWSISMIMMLLHSSCQSCNHSPAKKAMPTSIITDKEVIKKGNKNQDDEMELKHADVETVMRMIGLKLDQECNVLCNCIGSDSISRIFNNDEPSLHEVRQAFLLFDENKDGYIDASDLQRVIVSLGLGEGLGLGEYEEMIAKFDTNRDMRIDMAEFTKVLEASIC